MTRHRCRDQDLTRPLPITIEYRKTLDPPSEMLVWSLRFLGLLGIVSLCLILPIYSYGFPFKFSWERINVLVSFVFVSSNAGIFAAGAIGFKRVLSFRPIIFSLLILLSTCSTAIASFFFLATMS